MFKFLLDSDVIIWYLRNDNKTVNLVQKLFKEGMLCCSAISLVEVKSGIKHGEEEITNFFLDSLECFAVNKDVANLTGEYIREYKIKSITLNMVDTIIAATCIFYDLILFTYNKKHYPIKEIKFYKYDKI